MEADREHNLSSDNQGEQQSGSGANSLAGYDYQCDVSIWLALDLILNLRLTQMIELEPSTEEDIEAQLTAFEPNRVTTQVVINNYTLIVQVKLRNGNAWTVNDINRLLRHGSENRVSAAQRLSQSNTQYLLITNAALNGETRNLMVKSAGSWPKKGNLPLSTANFLPADADGRIAIIGNFDEERLVDEIKRLLIEQFGIPNARWIECFKVLREEAHLRMRGAGQGQWHQKEISQILRHHDGFLGSSRQLDSYVRPSNWESLRNAMRPPKYAAIIIGQSGTGKTLATSALYEELRRENVGLTRVSIRSPQQLRDDRTPAPVLYDIEDPWGRYDFEPESRHWNDELSRLFASAGPDKLVIATSRRDVASSSGALNSVKQWIVSLETEHYGKQERQQIFRKRIPTLPRDVQLLAADSEKEVLDKLETPLEIEKFFDALRFMERSDDKQKHGFIRDAISRAHEQSIEFTVVQQIEHRKDVRAAAIIWAFLKASDHLSLLLLRNLDADLAERITDFGKGSAPLVEFLVAARNLRMGVGSVTYHHPRVEAGIVSALKRQPGPVQLALRELIDLLADPDGPGDTGGIGAAVRIIAAVKPSLDLTLKPRRTAQSVIDNWLTLCLIDPDSKFAENLRIAALVGSAECNAAEFARYLLYRPNRAFGSFHVWARPDHLQDWYDRLHADPKISMIAGRFVREMLPVERDDYDVSLVDDLSRLADNLVSCYLEAAKAIVHDGYNPSADVIVAGALRDLSGFEKVVDSAVRMLVSLGDEHSVSSERLNIINEVYNSDYSEHLIDNEEGHTAGELLKIYADHVRRVKGCRYLAEHRHAGILLSYWMRSLRASARIEAPSTGEMADAFAAAFDTSEEDSLWMVLTIHWDILYAEQLLSRMRKGSLNCDVRHAALACLVERMPNYVTSVVDELRLVGNSERLVELMIDFSFVQSWRRYDGHSYKVAANAALRSLDPALQELCRAARKDAKRKMPLSENAIALLIAPIQISSAVRLLRIRRRSDLPISIRSDIEWTLNHNDDKDACIEAIDAAIALQLHDITEGALHHQFSHVVAKALTATAESLDVPLPTHVLDFAKADGSPIRKALVQILADKPSSGHLPTLLLLIQDQWSTSSQGYGDDCDCFPIARSAAKVVDGMKSLDTEVLEKLQEIAFETSDRVLRTQLLAILVARGGSEFHERMFELAVSPGRIKVRRDAAHALLVRMKSVSPNVVARINADVVATNPTCIAIEFILIAAFRCSLEHRLNIARRLSADTNRRVLILLMLWPRVYPSEETKVELRRLLPDQHPSIPWLELGPNDFATDGLIADLGDPLVCREVLNWLNPND